MPTNAVVFNQDVSNALPIYDVYRQVVYALKASKMETVVVGGKLLLKDGELLTVDEAAAKAKEYGAKVQASLKQ
jgi:5-methylthioadenosine/S-adenosylhomocysteine deaminase